MNLFDATVDSLVSQAHEMAAKIAALPLESQVDALNRIRYSLHQVSPFQFEPVDLVLWLPDAHVAPNEYNPNVVQRPEMELLNTSVDVDGATQPMPTHVARRAIPALIAGDEDGTLVDGEHRYKTFTGRKKISARMHGYVPVTVTHTRTDAERMASTVRHNRARGVHKLDAMSNIVLSMLQAGWTDDEIAKAMGMDADEILRMRQVSGIAKAFERQNYNRAWVNDDEDSIESVKALD